MKSSYDPPWALSNWAMGLARAWPPKPGSSELDRCGRELDDIDWPLKASGRAAGSLETPAPVFIEARGLAARAPDDVDQGLALEVQVLDGLRGELDVATVGQLTRSTGQLLAAPLQLRRDPVVARSYSPSSGGLRLSRLMSCFSIAPRSGAWR